MLDFATEVVATFSLVARPADALVPAQYAALLISSLAPAPDVPLVVVHTILPQDSVQEHPTPQDAVTYSWATMLVLVIPLPVTTLPLAVAPVGKMPLVSTTLLLEPALGIAELMAVIIYYLARPQAAA